MRRAVPAVAHPRHGEARDTARRAGTRVATVGRRPSRRRPPRPGASRREAQQHPAAQVDHQRRPAGPASRRAAAAATASRPRPGAGWRRQRRGRATQRRDQRRGRSCRRAQRRPRWPQSCASPRHEAGRGGQRGQGRAAIGSHGPALRTRPVQGGRTRMRGAAARLRRAGRPACRWCRRSRSCSSRPRRSSSRAPCWRSSPGRTRDPG